MPSASSCTIRPPRARASAFTAFSPGDIQGLARTTPRSAFAPSFATRSSSTSGGVAVEILTLTTSGASRRNGLPTAVHSMRRDGTTSVLQQGVAGCAPLLLSYACCRCPLLSYACCSSNALWGLLPFRGLVISSPVSKSQSSQPPPSRANGLKFHESASPASASVALAQSSRQWRKPMTFLKRPGLFSTIHRRFALARTYLICLSSWPLAMHTESRQRPHHTRRPMRRSASAAKNETTSSSETRPSSIT